MHLKILESDTISSFILALDYSLSASNLFFYHLSEMEKDRKSPEAFNNYSYGPFSAFNKTRIGTKISNRIFVGGLPSDVCKALSFSLIII